ncbi:MAG TPA: thioredoxin domain-containing protein [Catalimonadaceae bacterium]|nr:thioredoxin domain-containing protein [Catalimonadaceae bacterium]
MPNRLINSTSPYLLQHAHNPVDWYPWGEEALEKARTENKLILLSIGYSACHWCHVMEKNCFENEVIASIMNQNFICIKVDREERPDVDNVYMDAVHLMGSRGGWPLNVFLTPDQLPFYGGTYYPPEQWVQILEELATVYKRKPEELEKIGKNLQSGLQTNDLERHLPKNQTDTDTKGFETIRNNFQKLKKDFDEIWGGFGQAPKFPMPSVYDFLLYYHHLFDDKDALGMVTLSLEKMAYGGIHDQLAGGFSRYSVDSEWKVPHFEKMLYDNAQLLSLYSHTYCATLDILYRDVAFSIANFVKNELTSPEGAFYSALDADSEGEEGKFYTWTKAEILEILGEEGQEFCTLFQVSEEGNFENGTNVLWRTTSEEDFSLLYSNRSHPEMHKYVVECRRKLLEVRKNRVAPGLDDKILTSWNALMTKGFIDAYRAFDQPEILKLAYDNANFIREKLTGDEGKLWHTYKDGKAHTDGFLDDYAFTIDAYVALYEATFHEEWLLEARKLADYAIAHFYDQTDGLFFYTSNLSPALIARKKEIMDNVIPSSNSAMAMSLHRLGSLFYDEEYQKIVKRMLKETEPLIQNEIRYMSNWLQVWFMNRFPIVELAIVGKNSQKFRKELDKIFYPNKIICGTTSESKLPLLENRFTEPDKTQVFVCQNNVCRLPTDTIPAALRQLKLIKEEVFQLI